MATAVSEIQHGRMARVRVYEWTLTDGETGDAIEVPESDVSVEGTGTWSGATLTIEGSMTPESGGTFLPAKDQAGAAISWTANGSALVLQNFYRMRPKVTGGSSSSLKVRIICT